MYTKRSFLLHAALLMAVMSVTACSKTEAAPSAATTTAATAAPAAVAVPTTAASSAQLGVGIRITEPEQAPAAPQIPGDSYDLKATLATAGQAHGGEYIDWDSYGYPVINGQKTKDGYPVFQISCDLDSGMCQDMGNNVIGDIVAVSQNLTPVRNADVLRKDWKCNYVCLDADGQVAGAVQPDMLAYLDKHNLVNGAN